MSNGKMIGSLEITILGPFVYEERSTEIRVHAPRCDNHVAAASTVLNAIPMPGVGESLPSSVLKKLRGSRKLPMDGAAADERIYRIMLTQIPKPNPTAKLLSLKNTVDIYTVDAAPPSSKDCYFCLVLPKPRAMAGINPVMAKIKKNGRQSSNYEEWATAARLYYDDVDYASPLFMNVKGISSSFYEPDFDVENKKVCHGDLTIQHVGPVRDDVKHREAISCFRHTAELIDADLRFDPKSPAEFRPGDDCHSAIIRLGTDV